MKELNDLEKKMYEILKKNLSDIKKINGLLHGLGYHPYTIMESETEEIIKEVEI